MHFQIMWEHAAHPELRNVLRKLEERFGARLHLLPSDNEWLTFQVHGLTDEVLLRMLERDQNEIFGVGCRNFQVVRQFYNKAPGVSVTYLPNTSSESGFWYYT